jgi:hypothetical protein
MRRMEERKKDENREDHGKTKTKTKIFIFGKGQRYNHNSISILYEHDKLQNG